MRIWKNNPLYSNGDSRLSESSSDLQGLLNNLPCYVKYIRIIISYDDTRKCLIWKKKK